MSTEFAWRFAERDAMLQIMREVAMLTNEGDDVMFGVYVSTTAHPNGVRAKGSTLDMIERARAIVRGIDAP